MPAAPAICELKPLDADILIERRRMKRRITLWRGVAVVAIVALAAFALTPAGGPGGAAGALGISQHVARIGVNGFITDDREMQTLLDRLAASTSVKAVIVHINSPGGSSAGGEALYEGLRRVAADKPMVAVFGTTAASAAYMAGIAADRIVARGNTITGSVGVIMQWPDVSGLLAKLGVKFEEVKSGPLKASPTPYKPLDEATRQTSQEMIDEAQTWFLSLVSQRRKLSSETLEAVKNGRVFTGRQAAANGLIDAVGDERTARQWLASEKNVPQSLPVVDWEPERTSPYSLIRLAASVLRPLLGDSLIDSLTFFDQNGGLAAQRLDGLVSVWQVEKSQ